jgi:DNA adenine methylase
MPSAAENQHNSNLSSGQNSRNGSFASLQPKALPPISIPLNLGVSISRSGPESPKHRSIPSNRLLPILKWAGGKKQELKYILPNLPSDIKRYYEPFVGGGAVYTSIKADSYFINDKSDELISLYTCLIGPSRAAFFEAIEEVIHSWDILTRVVSANYEFFVDTYRQYSAGILDDDKTEKILLGFIVDNSAQFNGMFTDKFNFNTPNFLREIQVNTVRKIKRMKVLEKSKSWLPDADISDNIETALKSAFYMHFRQIYNNLNLFNVSPPVQSAIFLFIRNYAYSGMFRYNTAGEFNVPYGGIGYNRQNFQKKVDNLKSIELQSLLRKTSIQNLDFEDFLAQQAPTRTDFIFLDPPYDSEFSTYARNEFTKVDQTRLAKYLVCTCTGNWMLIIKNTNLIKSLYYDNGLNIRPFDKTYRVSFMNRNDRNTEHLLITNY